MDETGKEQRAFYAEKGFGLRMGFGKRPALLCIDMLRAFTDPDALLGSNLDREIEATNTLLSLAHERRFPVLFSTIKFEEAELRDAGLWSLKNRGAAILRAGTDGVELDPKIDFRPGDQVLVKKYASCFFGTDLVSRLANLQVDTLLIAGCTTSGCVRATAVDAFQYGIRPMIVREAVGDRSNAAHEQSLIDLHSRYADVVSLAETQAYLREIESVTNHGE